MLQYSSKICIPLRKESVSLAWNLPVNSKIKILPKVRCWERAQGAGSPVWVPVRGAGGAGAFPRGEAGPGLVLFPDPVESTLKSGAGYNPA